MSEEWFRSQDWSPQAREDFEQRLRRAREINRPQYLRIKALALLGHGGNAETVGARELLSRVIDNYPEAGDVVMAHEHLGEIDVSEGQPASAVEHYRTALRLAPERNVYGDAALRLPELLIEEGGTHKRSEAESLLRAVRTETPCSAVSAFATPSLARDSRTPLGTVQTRVDTLRTRCERQRETNRTSRATERSARSMPTSKPSKKCGCSLVGRDADSGLGQRPTA